MKRGKLPPTVPETSLTSLPQLPRHKVKFKKPLQRACNEADAKGKICAGHLKRWFYMADAVEQACGDLRETLGPNVEVYRCEHCRTLYFPGPEEPRGRNVAGFGQKSQFGLTLAPKNGGDPAKSADAKDKT